MDKMCLPSKENPAFVIVRDGEEGFMIEQYHEGKLYGMLDLDGEEAQMLAVGMLGLILESGGK